MAFCSFAVLVAFAGPERSCAIERVKAGLRRGGAGVGWGAASAPVASSSSPSRRPSAASRLRKRRSREEEGKARGRRGPYFSPIDFFYARGYERKGGSLLGYEVVRSVLRERIAGSCGFTLPFTPQSGIFNPAQPK